MITVKDVLDKGIELHPNDKFRVERTGWDSLVEFAPRKNKGVQPVADDVLVDAVFHNGNKRTARAIDLIWLMDGGPFQVRTWTPSLKNWDDMEEIKVGLTCSDELDEIAKECVSHYSNDEAEWKNGDRCIYDGSYYAFVGMTPTFNDVSCIIFDSKNGIKHVSVNKLSKPETPEQIERAAKYLYENSPNAKVWDEAMSWGS